MEINSFDISKLSQKYEYWPQGRKVAAAQEMGGRQNSSGSPQFPKIELFDTNGDGVLDARDTFPQEYSVVGQDALQPMERTVDLSSALKSYQAGSPPYVPAIEVSEEA